MRFIGITGGVGAGKTEILKYIGQHYKCEIYLADDIGHKVKEPGTEGYQALVELLGRDILRADGQIDKPSMAAKIFADPALLEKVNQIIHPAVKKYLADRLVEALSKTVMEQFLTGLSAAVNCSSVCVICTFRLYVGIIISSCF